MNDPLADLVLEMQEQTVDQFTFLELAHVDVPLLQAEWLRANRDRVLEALGGKVQDRRVELRDHTIAMSWLFPLGEDQDAASDWEPLFIRRPLGEDQ